MTTFLSNQRDGMSFVGNEYWAGSVATSSDPAAASCTQVAFSDDNKHDYDEKVDRQYDSEESNSSFTMVTF